MLVDLEVVLQVGAHAGQVVHHRDVQRLQQGRWPDARALQDLRRGDGARAQQHFALCMGGLGLVFEQVGHADGALAGEQDAVGQRVGDDGEVGALRAWSR